MVIIIGAGLAGLTAANVLKKAGRSVLVLEASPEYGKSGEALISLSLIGNHAQVNQKELQENVISEMKLWFSDADSWKHLKTYHIDYALPNDDQVSDEPNLTEVQVSAKCFVCGDYLMNGSINAAMKSGRLAAEAIINTTPS